MAALRLAIAAGSTPAAVETYSMPSQGGAGFADAAVIADLAGRGGSRCVDVSETAVKKKLHDNTAWAVSRGIFGVHTFVIG